MKMRGTDYEVVGYDEYLKEFEEQATADFKNEAEAMLERELEEEPKDGETVEVYLEAEKTKGKAAVKFVFNCQLSEESLDLIFQHFVQE